MSLTAEECAQAVVLYQEGRSYRYIARLLHCSPTTILRVVERHRETGSNSRRPGSGRRRLTDAVQDRFIVLGTLRDRFQTAVRASQLLREVHGVQVSKWTVRRRLSEAGLSSRRPASGPELLAQHRTARLEFARGHLNWTEEQWRVVVFADESRFCLRSPDGRERVWRRPGERFAPCNISSRVSFGGGSIMVWGAISMEHRTGLLVIERGSLTAERYLHEILAVHVAGIAQNIGQNFVYMDDNARPHRARCVMQFLERQGWGRMEWPARSPDLNPIEHIWDMLGRRVRARVPAPDTLNQLRNALLEEWEGISQEDVRNLITSMRRRLQAVIRARGGNTSY